MTFARIEDLGIHTLPDRAAPSVVVVRVAEASLHPMAGAVVTLEPGRNGGMTDSLGVVRIEGVRPGRYQVRAMQMGYWSIADSITHIPGGTDVAVVLVPAYRGLDECLVAPAAPSP